MGNKGAKGVKSSAAGLTEVFKKLNPTKINFNFFIDFLFKQEINLLLANTHYTREQILQWHTGFLVKINLLTYQCIFKLK